jgi:hypothetical protein
MNYQKIKKEFDNLDESQQWVWADKFKIEITLDLDNDNTTFTFDKEDKTNDCTLCMFKADIGNRSGISFLLSALGFKGHNV